jgi:hypothetical protein
MAKRNAGNQLTHDNWDEEEETEEVLSKNDVPT